MSASMASYAWCPLRKTRGSREEGTWCTGGRGGTARPVEFTAQSSIFGKIAYM
jgi:hypothetical protein